MPRYKTKTRPGLVTLYDIRPGNGAGLFLQPRSPHRTYIMSVIRLCDIKKITELTEEYHFKIVLVACSQEYTTTSTKKHDIKVENKLQHHHILLTSHWLTVQPVKLTEKLVG